MLGSPSVSQLLHRRKGKSKRREHEAFSSDQVAVVVTEGEQIEPKTVKDAGCQSIEFDFSESRYEATNNDFLDTDDTVRFYIGLPSIYGNTSGCFRANLLICYTANTVAQQISRVHYCTYET